jgi:signal peptidase I
MSVRENNQVEPVPETTPTPAPKPVKSKTKEWTESIVVALVLALIIRTFVVQAFKIPSGSMEDTLLVGDHLLVSKFIYGMQIPFTEKRILTIRHPRQGDVIVFEFPEDRNKSYFERRDFIKRVVGIPGDVVEVREKQVYVNGVKYELPQEIHKEKDLVPAEYGPRDFMKPITVPADSYFVMGDNRDRSYDSRFWGFVTDPEIKGKAIIKYWSWDSERHLPRLTRIGGLIH